MGSHRHAYLCMSGEGSAAFIVAYYEGGRRSWSERISCIQYRRPEGSRRGRQPTRPREDPSRAASTGAHAGCAPRYLAEIG